MIQLYKRNNKGEPILWKIEPLVNNKLSIIYGKVNGNLHTEEFITNRTIEAEIKTNEALNNTVNIIKKKINPL